MSTFTITATIPKQGASRREQEEGVETIFTFTAKTAKKAQELVDGILLKGLRRTFEMPESSLTPSQTVFYPAHLVKRITVAPPLPEL